MSAHRRWVVVTMVAVLVSALAAGPASAEVPVMVTVAGTGTAGFSGDGDAATSAELDMAMSVAVDADGNLYIADTANHRIRKVDAATGDIETIAGTGIAGYSGDDDPAVDAQLQDPEGVAVDAAGNVYVADFSNNRIRKIDQASGDITTIAGTGVGGYSGDGIDATTAQINNPSAVALDTAGNVYFTELNGNRVRKVDIGSGLISTLAGTGTQDFSGDGDDATLAELNHPQGLAIDGDGNIYISDSGNYRVRMIDAATGDIDTIAGDGSAATDGDGGPAVSAGINFPVGIALDSGGNLYVVENVGHVVRVVDTNGDIDTILPIGSDTLSQPYGIATDADGNLFVGDVAHHRIVALAVADTDGDTFADLVDNFPEVYSRCRLRQATLIGTESADTINGTSGPDVIMGFGGADLINGLEGDDLICAGNGADYITGGDGKDKIYAENGTDAVFGNEMSDRIYGGDGDDTLYGNGGTRDRLYGGGGTDVLDGGTGTDDRCTLGETYVGTTCETIL